MLQICQRQTELEIGGKRYLANVSTWVEEKVGLRMVTSSMQMNFWPVRDIF